MAPLNAPCNYDPSAAPNVRTALERKLKSLSPAHSPRRPSFSDGMERARARVQIIVRLEMNMLEMLEMNMQDTGAPVAQWLRDKFAADLLSDLRYDE